LVSGGWGYEMKKMLEWLAIGVYLCVPALFIWVVWDAGRFFGC
ncbi:hypothetical protein LCGC14_2370650, partial [marine sediment metagenome]